MTKKNFLSSTLKTRCVLLRALLVLATCQRAIDSQEHRIRIYLSLYLFTIHIFIHSFTTPYSYYYIFPLQFFKKTLNALYFWFILSACFRLLKKSPLIENTMQQRANADSVRSENEKVRQANEERLKEKRMVRVLFRFVSSPGARIARACSLCVLIFGCTRSPSLDTACLSLSLSFLLLLSLRRGSQKRAIFQSLSLSYRVACSWN